ncbi:unnamed protein product [Ranitomeya imitator]|uniref:ribonuclease H n=1 Tax=Ranitomeya imitator TaxID=111125 RepID=A0ABN9MHA0_9NEOB|nr:unnamed protein product [Ranitomeya imitator]
MCSVQELAKRLQGLTLEVADLQQHVRNYSGACSEEPKVMVDCGSALNLIDQQFLDKYKFDSELLSSPIPVVAIDNTPLEHGCISRKVTGFPLIVNMEHQECIDLFVLAKLPCLVILGLPWLKMHNPLLDWSSSAIRFWGQGCYGNCFNDHIDGNCFNAHIAAVVKKELPEAIQDFWRVFLEVESQALPPHRDYNCAIEFIPGATLPKSRLFNLTIPKREALKEYLQTSLAAGHIRPSKSLVAVGFFFVKKKDGGLRPCLDFWEINKITVRNPYPLPLIPDLFNQLTRAKWFSKIDLRGAYNLLRVKEGNEWKTAFNTPEVNNEKEECILQKGLVVVAELGFELKSSMLEVQNAAQQLTLRMVNYLCLELCGELCVLNVMSLGWLVIQGFQKLESRLVKVSGGQGGKEKSSTKAFVKEIVRLHLVPMDIVSDRGPQFVAHFWHTFCDRLKIGAAVREEESFSGNLDRVWTNVRHNLKEANRRSKKYFDKKRREALFAVGDMVWLSSRNLRLKIPSKKLGPKFVGPFKVVQVVNSAAVRFDIPSSWRITSVFHASLLKKVDTPDKEAMPTVPPVDEDGEFEISRILDSRWHRGRLQYLLS